MQVVLGMNLSYDGKDLLKFKLSIFRDAFITPGRAVHSISGMCEVHQFNQVRIPVLMFWLTLLMILLGADVSPNKGSFSTF